MKKSKFNSAVKIESKRHAELWIYSFADMYMILSVFFIAIAVLYAAQIKKQMDKPPIHAQIPSAGRGPAAVESTFAVYFGNGTDLLDDEARESLALILPILRSAKGQVEVEGYSDGLKLSSGSGFRSNLDLSNSRAVRVAEWMIQNGVPAKKIRTFSYGDGQTYAKDEQTMKSNRRVVVKITSPPSNRQAQ